MATLQLIEQNSNIRSSFIGNNIWIRAGTEIMNSVIGDDVFVNFRSRIQKSRIGNNTQIASNVKIGGEDKKSTIGANCWIGADAIISQGIEIGNNCVIGAYTIVNQNIPDNSVVYGREVLTIKARNFVMDGLPQFKMSLKRQLILKDQGREIKSDCAGNFITADIVGEITKIGTENILIGNKATNGFIKVEKNVKIGNKNIFEGAGTISIGSGTRIGNNVHIVSNSHDYHYSSLPMIFQPVNIGKNVTIEDSAVIIGGVSIPDNTVIKQYQFVKKTRKR